MCKITFSCRLKQNKGPDEGGLTSCGGYKTQEIQGGTKPIFPWNNSPSPTATRRPWYKEFNQDGADMPPPQQHQRTSVTRLSSQVIPQFIHYFRYGISDVLYHEMHRERT